MKSFKNLTTKQLGEMFGKAQAELERREKVEKAQKEISAILKKYNISGDEIDLSGIKKRLPSSRPAVEKTRPSKARKAKQKAAKFGPAKLKSGDKRATVAPKFCDPNTGKKWSGRGRSPEWVLGVCEAESITVEQFKADPRFLISG